MRHFRRGDFVVCPDGRIGMADADQSEDTSGMICVKFGSAGPHVDYSFSALRWATPDEICDAGFDGVGRNMTPTERRSIRDEYKDPNRLHYLHRGRPRKDGTSPIIRDRTT